MNMQMQADGPISEAAYLEQERLSPIKHEYLGGKITAMARASRAHNLIVSNLIVALGTQLKGRPCRVYPSDMRLKIAATGLYTYPDIMVVCGEERFADNEQDTLLNPDLIIEVLSDSTERYDRGAKFAHYRKLKSLQEYLMVSQTPYKLERYFKNKDGLWVLSETEAKNPRIVLDSIGCELSHEAVYLNL